MVSIRRCHDLFAVGWCWPEKVTVVLLDVGCPRALALVMLWNWCCFSRHSSGMKTLRTETFCLLFSSGEITVCWFGTFIFYLCTGVLACCPMPRISRFCGSGGFVVAGGISGALPAALPQPLSVRAPEGAHSLLKSAAHSLPWLRCP